MSQPASRSDLKEYALRRLGKPVLEINVDDDQIDDLIDDALQMFNERHYNGSERMFLKHKFTENDVANFKGLDREESVHMYFGSILTVKLIEQGTSGYTTENNVSTTGGSGDQGASFSVTAKDGKVTKVELPESVRTGTGGTGFNYKVGDILTINQSGSSSDAQIEVTSVDDKTVWERRDNFLRVPPSVLGINKVFGIKGSNIRSNLFGLEYQLFLNDLYQFGSVDILSYYMVKSYLETLDMVLNNGNFIPFRFNQRQDRLYIDTDRDFVDEGAFVIIDCYRLLDPTENTQVFNDPFLKRYVTALIKKQWGQNLIKFQGAQLPGGITMNGRQLYDDAIAEIAEIEAEMSSRYELPPMDMIG